MALEILRTHHEAAGILRPRSSFAAPAAPVNVAAAGSFGGAAAGAADVAAATAPWKILTFSFISFSPFSFYISFLNSNDDLQQAY